MILDVTGTVVDFGSRAPLNAMCESFHGVLGRVPSERILRASMGKPIWEHARDVCLTTWEGVRLSAAENDDRVGIHPASPPGSGIDVSRCAVQWTEAIMPDLRERLPDWIAHRNEWVTPAVPKVLRELRTMGVGIAFFTSYPSDTASPFRRLLDETFGDDHCIPLVTADHIASCSTSLAPSPSDSMALFAAELLGAHPAECLLVGDTVIDMREGERAGMRPVGVLDSGNEIGVGADVWAAMDELERERMRRHASLVLTRAGAIATVKTVKGLRWFF